MGNGAGAAQQVIVSPKGGGAQKGIGEKFAPDLQTGTADFTVPIALPPGRNGFQPQLNLVYSTGNGNGPFGLGWGLSIAGVSRKTWKGVPRYNDETDVFILSGAEDLVPLETSPNVSRYRPRTEGLFAVIEPVLGAGVSMGAGAPSWSELVRLMLQETLEKGLEFYESVPAADNPAQPPIEFLPDGTVRTGGTGTWRFEQPVSEVKHYTVEQEQTAREVLVEVAAKGSSTEVERLMQGAQVCYELCGQHLFRLLTRILYASAKEPSDIHRAIAELAHAQEVPVRGPGLFPGWDSIITYNIDVLMSEALTEQKVPHAAWAMKGDGLRGDPDELARKSQWYQPVFHLHGYTPRRLFLITDVRYVFSTSQYLTTYKGPRSKILEFVHEGFLANPVHIALYVGCSFADEAMNGLLRDAFAEYPGRYHYALLKWPRDRQGTEPAASEIEAESAQYLEFGVRPVWFDDFNELPGLIRQVQ